MNRTINIRNIILHFVFLASIIGILFLKWSINNSLILYILPVITTVYLCVIKKSIIINKKIIILLLCLMIISILNLLIPASRDYYVDEMIKGTILPLFVGFYFITISKTKDIQFEKLFKFLFILLNLFSIINFLIMLRQITDIGFMVHNRTENMFYTDMITGFIGANGTHKLSYLYIATIYLNYIFFNSKSKFYRITSKMFFIYTLISSLYISSFNDNRTYYFLLVFSLLPILINKVGKIANKKKIMKIIVSILIFSTSLSLLYRFNNSFNSFVNENIYNQYIVKTIDRFNASTENTNEKGEERIELLKYSFSNTNLLYGKGIGSIHMVTESTLPKHFGINDITVRVYTGGIPYALIIILIYAEFYYLMFKKKDIKIFIFCILYSLISAFYTQAYSQIDKTFLICLAMYMISYSVNKEYNKKEIV